MSMGLMNGMHRVLCLIISMTSYCEVAWTSVRATGQSGPETPNRLQSSLHCYAVTTAGQQRLGRQIIFY